MRDSTRSRPSPIGREAQTGAKQPGFLGVDIGLDDLKTLYRGAPHSDALSDPDGASMAVGLLVRPQEAADQEMSRERP